MERTMPNSQTPASRAARQATAARANQATVDAGGRRLGVLLPPYPLCRFSESETPEKQPVSGTAGAKFADFRRRSPTIGENTG